MENAALRPPATILEAENRIQNTLELLRELPLNDELRLGLSFLSRPGFRTVVQLEEDGRKKRSSASISNWTPDRGEVVIFFEKLDEPVPVPSAPSKPSGAFDLIDEKQSSEQLRQCCEALAAAEQAGKAFVALKWFRDEALPEQTFPWAQHSEQRQRILSLAIERGLIRTNRITNPKNPQFPTTTVSLERSSTGLLRSRFNPLPIKGEPLSATILRDRGDY